MLRKVFVKYGGSVYSMADNYPAEYWDAVREIAEDNFDALGAGQLTSAELGGWLDKEWRPNFLVWDYDRRESVLADIPDEVWNQFVNDLIAAVFRVAERKAERWG